MENPVAFLVERKALLGKTSLSNQQVPIGSQHTDE
jgi:hypothetical protein